MKQSFTQSIISFAIVFSASLALPGCGSGSSSPATPSISSVTAIQPKLGQPTTFSIAGTTLDNSLAPTAVGCSNLTVIASSSTTSRQFTCTPTSSPVAISIAYGAATPFTTSIPASGPWIASLSATAVSGIASTTPAYGKSVTFTLTGFDLPATFTPVVSGCSNVAMASSTSTTSRQVTCTPESLSLNFSIPYGGSAPFTSTVAVPRPNVTFVTSMGSIVVELYPEYAPITVKNFMAYVNSGFYANTVFHRIIRYTPTTPFAVNQGGGFVETTGTGLSAKTATFAPIVLESNKGLSNLKYTIGMARLQAADTATSQFYFNALNNTGFDYVDATNPGYAVFGKAISGTSVLDNMNLVATSAQGVPTTTVMLQSATQTQ